MKQCVEWFIEGTNAWQNGVLGFFLRLRGMIPAILLTFLTMGVPFWWPTAIPASLMVPSRFIFVSTVMLSGVVVSGGFGYLRWRTIRSLEIKAALHLLAHEIRNEQVKIFHRNTRNTIVDDVDEEVNLYEYFDRLSNLISNYFKSQIHGNGIAAGIRLAIYSPVTPSSTEIVYSTFGRSLGLNSKRAKTTEDIPSNQGIPRYLMTDQQNSQGVLIYNDLNEAVKQDAFKKTKNDELYKDEIISMMVAPLNGWDGKNSSMIGLLYVTSRKKDVFKAKHVDAMRFTADIVATSVAFTITSLINSGRIKTIKRRTT
jgi:hypothetical protein